MSAISCPFCHTYYTVAGSVLHLQIAPRGGGGRVRSRDQRDQRIVFHSEAEPCYARQMEFH